MNHSKIKLALVINVFVTGGAERMVAQLATHLDRERVEVSVISMFPALNNTLEQSIRDQGIPLYFLDKKMGKDPGAMIRMWKLLDQIKPDMVHTHLESTFYALPWAFAHRVPMLHTVHNQPEKEFSPRKRSLHDLFRKLGTVHFVAISRGNQALMCDYYHITPQEVPWVNNPVELGKYYRSEAREAGVRFIHVGRLTEQKNQRLMIQAMAAVRQAIPNAHLLILGEGELRPELERQIRELNLQDAVTLYGLTPTPEHLLAKADVFVNSSHYEGLPLSVLEAEAAMLPIIATDVGGVADIVRDNGALIPAGDLEGLTREMIRFGSDPELRQRCGRVSREIAGEYDAALCAGKYLEIYQKLVRVR